MATRRKRKGGSKAVRLRKLSVLWMKAVKAKKPHTIKRIEKMATELGSNIYK